MTKEELKSKRKEYKAKYSNEMVKWQNIFYEKWEIELLKDLKAIEGERISKQIVAIITQKTDAGEKSRIEYFGGDYNKTQSFVDMINSQQAGGKAELSELPHIYSEYIELDSEIKTEIADKEYAEYQEQKRLNIESKTI